MRHAWSSSSMPRGSGMRCGCIQQQRSAAPRLGPPPACTPPPRRRTTLRTAATCSQTPPTPRVRARRGGRPPAGRAAPAQAACKLPLHWHPTRRRLLCLQMPVEWGDAVKDNQVTYDYKPLDPEVNRVRQFHNLCKHLCRWGCSRHSMGAVGGRRGGPGVRAPANGHTVLSCIRSRMRRAGLQRSAGRPSAAAASVAEVVAPPPPAHERRGGRQRAGGED